MKKGGITDKLKLPGALEEDSTQGMFEAFTT
jgi:hypothetical protein